MEEKELEKELTLISEYTQHLSQTIDDFRSFYKTDKEKSKTSFEKICHTVEIIVSPYLEQAEIKLIKNMQTKDTILTYPSEIAQVVLNLIKNANDAIKEKSIESPQIELHSFNHNNGIVLEVIDNAGGIPVELIDEIFNPYFTTKEKNDGSGLGLYMSKMIIEDHCNGKLSCKNNSLGATFTIYLPTTEEEI